MRRIFTAQNLSDAGKGAASGEVMIHELVHQWWGLGNMFDSSDETDGWSAEGLTVYTTYRIVRQLYGEEYALEHYVNQWQKAVDDYNLNFYVRCPEYLEMLPEEKTAGDHQQPELCAAILRDAAENSGKPNSWLRRGGHGPDSERPV